MWFGGTRQFGLSSVDRGRESEYSQIVYFNHINWPMLWFCDTFVGLCPTPSRGLSGGYIRKTTNATTNIVHFLINSLKVQGRRKS